jgi:hypothetical protein
MADVGRVEHGHFTDWVPCNERMVAPSARCGYAGLQTVALLTRTVGLIVAHRHFDRVEVPLGNDRHPILPAPDQRRIAAMTLMSHCTMSGRFRLRMPARLAFLRVDFDTFTPYY